MSSLKGFLLIASPKLRDPSFYKSVVLIIRHEEDGAVGLVLNRPSNTALSEIWDRLSDTSCQSEELLQLGGPVEGPLMAVHARPMLSDSDVVEGVYFSAEQEKLEQLVARPEGPARFFIGYAGWTAGQLEDELEQGAWATLRATPETIFGPAEDAWEQLTKQSTALGILAALNIKHVPDDPSLN